MNILNIGLGLAAALVYALGLDFSGMTFNVYAALVGPTAITVWIQKLIDTSS